MSNDLIKVTKDIFKSLTTIDLHLRKNMFVLLNKQLDIIWSTGMINNSSSFLQHITSLSESNVGHTAFLLTSLRKTTSISYDDQHEYELFKNLNSIATPIYNNKLKIIGYIGVFEDNLDKNDSVVTFLEAISRLISSEFLFYSVQKKYIIEKDFKNGIFKSKEIEIIELILKGNKDEEISKIMHISVPTVRSYISKMFDRFHINSRVQLINIYYLKKMEFLIESLNLKEN